MRRLNPEGLPEPVRYDHAVVHETSGLVFVAGQVGWDGHGELVGEDMATQFAEICRHWDVILGSLGLARSSVVRVLNLVTSIDEYFNGSGPGAPTTAQLYGSFFEGSRPASMLVEVSKFGGPGLRIESEAIFASTP